MTPTPLRLGIMGTAKVAKFSILDSLPHVPEVNVLGISARDQSRAQQYADKFHIPRVYNNYQTMLEDKEIDAIYLPLTNAFHYQWLVKSIEAGKHVLCEKPLVCNAEDGLKIQALLQQNPNVFVTEAFAYRHHPVMRRVAELVPLLGPIKRIEASYCMPVVFKSWNVYQYALAGGAMMDTGVYTVNMARHIAHIAYNGGADVEPRVAQAECLIHKPDKNIDRATKAKLMWDCGIEGQIHTSIWSATVLKSSLKVVGENGYVHVLNPILPQFWHRIISEIQGKKMSEKLHAESTFIYQLRNFARDIRAGKAADISDAIKNMQVVDAIYQKLGMPLRVSQY